MVLIGRLSPLFVFVCVCVLAYYSFILYDSTVNQGELYIYTNKYGGKKDTTNKNDNIHNSKALKLINLWVT